MIGPAGRGLALSLRDVALDVPAGGGRTLRVLALGTLECPSGARIAVTGPSGSGKTSLLGVLAGLQRPDRGTIAWNGRDIAGLPPRALDAWRLRHVGLVFQEAELVPELDVLANVLLPASFTNLTVASALRERALGLLARVGLSDPGRRASALSTGERQRAAVARALLLDPPLILADEPTASLDREAARLVGDLLVAVARESGATLLVATHDPDLAARLPERWPLRDGRIEGRAGAVAA